MLFFVRYHSFIVSQCRHCPPFLPPNSRESRERREEEYGGGGERFLPAPPFPPPHPDPLLHNPDFRRGFAWGRGPRGGREGGGKEKERERGAAENTKQHPSSPPSLMGGGYFGGGVHRQSRCTPPLPSVHARSARMHPSLWERWTLATRPRQPIFSLISGKRGSVGGGEAAGSLSHAPVASPHLLNPLLSHRRGGSF
nr:hypothetical protein [Morchella crassipes]